MSYSELDKQDSLFFARINHRCLIFILCRNSVGAVIGYTSSINNHVVPVLINSDLDRQLLGKLIDEYKPSYLWVPSDHQDDFAGMKKTYDAYDYVLLETNYGMEYPLYDDLALLLTTSGSTGSPKFVRQSYKNIKANTESIIEYLGIDENERAITTLPMNYTYGLSIINTHLAAGATVLLTDKSLMQKEFWVFFKDEQATSFGGVPYTYEMLDRIRFTRMDLPFLKTMTQAGGKLSLKLHEKIAEYAKEHGKRFVVMYGQCEATARMGYLPADKAIEKCGSMGIAIPGGKFDLIDQDGKIITKPFVSGELVYKGDNVTLGYAEGWKDLAKGDERFGVLETGDMAQFDEDGYFYIVGRKKRFLKIFGNRVNLDEVDRMISDAFPGVDVASCGIDDHMNIFVTDESKGEDIKKYISSKTGLNSSAFKTVYIPAIPRNDAGKVLYKDLDNYDI